MSLCKLIQAVFARKLARSTANRSSLERNCQKLFERFLALLEIVGGKIITQRPTNICALDPVLRVFTPEILIFGIGACN